MQQVQTRKLSALELTWLAFLLFVVLVLVFLLPLFPNDFWWYLRLGQDILRSGSLPAADTYSYTAAGTPFIYHAWLSAVTLWSTYQVGGVPLTVLLQGTVLGLFYFFFWLAAREIGVNYRLATILLVCAALAGSNNWQMRPQIFGYLLFSITVWIIIRWQNGKNRTLLLLPLVALLWTNFHGSYIMLYICLGSAIVFGAGDKKYLLAGSVSLVLFSLLNPDGLQVFTNTWTVLFNNASNNLYGTEWQPPINQGWQMNIFFLWLLIMIPLAFFSSGSVPILLWVWLLGFGWMALSGMRYIFWFLPILSLVSGLLIQPWVDRFVPENPRQSHSWIGYVLVIFLLIFPLAFLPGVRENWWQNSPVVHSNSTPIQAVAWLKAHPDLPGEIWNDYAYGSYLIYALPERKVWIDTRLYPYPPQQIDEYLTVSRAGYGWQDILARDGVRLVLAYRPDQPELVWQLNESPDWCAQYWDDFAAIFTLNNDQGDCPEIRELAPGEIVR